MLKYPVSTRRQRKKIEIVAYRSYADLVRLIKWLISFSKTLSWYEDSSPCRILGSALTMSYTMLVTACII